MRRLRLPAAAVVGLALLVLLQDVDADLRAGDRQATPEGLPSGVAAAALGGLRAPAIAALWIDAEEQWRAGRWWALRARYEMIVRLEPRIPAAWGILADRMMLDMADSSPTPDEAWAWTREGLELLDRGIAANPDSYWLRLQRLARLTRSLAASPEHEARFEAWRGRTVREAALDTARDLARLRPDRLEERQRVADVHKDFAYLDFRRAWLRLEVDPDARASILGSSAGFRRAAEAYRALGESRQSLAEYVDAFAALAEALGAGPAARDATALMREKLGPFKDYVEAAEMLETP